MANVRKRVLISWIGGNDLKVTNGDYKGPIVSILNEIGFDSVELLYNYPEDQVQPYLSWIKNKSGTNVGAHQVYLSSPVNFREIYQQANLHLGRVQSDDIELCILLSPGTPAMQAVWILLGKTYYSCRFYQSSVEEGVKEVDIPFELSAEYIPTANQLGSTVLSGLAQTEVPVDAAFDNIITRNPFMETLKARAQILAKHEVPVLVYGETGTGKELFARAIHNAGKRATESFVALNCGAIPTELVDSVLFGHTKGAFTGATSDKPGVFQQANGGTLFLDEFGELEHSIQVRLLRVLQEGTFIPVGGTMEKRVDVRLIAATHRNLIEDVAHGHFREDLFYRVAVGVLHLPPLREREGDLLLLARAVLKQLGIKDKNLASKKISVDAKNIILKHPWQGNIRELQSTLFRAALWCDGESINADDMSQALFEMPEERSGELNKDISQGVELKEIIGNIAVDYIQRALDYTGQNKTRAARLVGLGNYQTLNNWMKKYGISSQE